MFSLTALWTWFLSKLTNIRTIITIVIVLIILGLAGYGAWKGYDWIYQKGVAAQQASDKKVIDGLNATIAQDAKNLAAEQAKTKAAQTSLATYVASYNQYVAETKANDAKLAQQQQQLVSTLNGTISKLQTQLKQAQTGLTNDIPTFIPPDGSAACQLPRGLIVLYNASLTGTDSSGGFTTALGLDTDAYDPSGVSCSTFAGFLIDNGLAAYSNRALLIQWQTWYSDNEALIDAAIKAQQATPVPVAPSKTKPTTPSSTTAPSTSAPPSTPTTPAASASPSTTPPASSAGSGK
jgi:cytoskeletal protein RodZ